MKRLFLIAAASLVTVAQACAQTDVAPPADGGGKKSPPPPLKIGAVELSKVYDTWTKVKDFTADLEKRKAAQEDELKKMEKEIKEKIVMRDTAGINARVKASLQEEIVQIQAKADYRMKDWNEQVKKLLDDGIAKFYDEIQAEVEAYAKENGYTVVFKTESGKVSEASDTSRSDERISRRPFLYVDPAYDVTTEILTRLEEKYKKDKAAAPKEGNGGAGGEGK